MSRAAHADDRVPWAVASRAIERHKAEMAELDLEIDLRQFAAEVARVYFLWRIQRARLGPAPPGMFEFNPWPPVRVQ